MRVFVTGASGHVASGVIPELINAGHEVLGLARSDEAVAAVKALGAYAVRGDLDDVGLLHEAVVDVDGVIHLAFKHESMRTGDFIGALESDLRAIQAMATAIAETGKPFVGTSGTLLLAFAGVRGLGTEAITLEAGPRVDAENTVIGLADRGVRSSVIRLPPTVHSSLDLHGYLPTLIAIAREKGQAAYIGAGANRWPAGHTLDVARLYRLALEHAPPGSRLHAVGDEGIPFRQIAETIGRHLDVPVVSLAAEDAEPYFGFLTAFVGLDNPTSSARTRTLLDWSPRHLGLLADLDEGHYFTVPASS